MLKLKNVNYLEFFKNNLFATPKRKLPRQMRDCLESEGSPKNIKRQVNLW